MLERKKEDIEVPSILGSVEVCENARMRECENVGIREYGKAGMRNT